MNFKDFVGFLANAGIDLSTEQRLLPVTVTPSCPMNLAHHVEYGGQFRVISVKVTPLHDRVEVIYDWEQC